LGDETDGSAPRHHSCLESRWELHPHVAFDECMHRWLRGLSNRPSMAALLGDPDVGGVVGGSEDVDAPSGVLDRGQGVGLGAVEQVHGEEVARDDRPSLGVLELCTGRSVAAGAGSTPCFLRISQTVDGATVMPTPASSPVMRRYPQCSLLRAIRRTRRVIMGCPRWRPGDLSRDFTARRRLARSRCQRRIIAGVTGRGSPAWRVRGITAGSAANSARSTRSGFGRVVLRRSTYSQEEHEPEAHSRRSSRVRRQECNSTCGLPAWTPLSASTGPAHLVSGPAVGV
jgi:hypothetical protein